MTFGSAVATTLSWQELGGADYYGAHAPYLSRSPHLWFSPVEVGRLQNIQTEMLFTANVGTQNSDFYLWVSAEINGVWKIFARTDIMPMGYHTTMPVSFNIFENISGTISGLHFDTKFQSGEGDFSNMFSTYLVFESPPSPVPVPPAFILILSGLGLLGLAKRFRKEV